MDFFSHINEAIFATVTVKLKVELWSLSRENTTAQRVGNAWQSKRVKTSATSASKNALDVPQQKWFL